eukprot:2531525-Rhodomonas_salina.1
MGRTIWGSMGRTFWGSMARTIWGSMRRTIWGSMRRTIWGSTVRTVGRSGRRAVGGTIPAALALRAAADSAVGDAAGPDSTICHVSTEHRIAGMPCQYRASHSRYAMSVPSIA